MAGLQPQPGFGFMQSQPMAQPSRMYVGPDGLYRTQDGWTLDPTDMQWKDVRGISANQHMAQIQAQSMAPVQSPVPAPNLNTPTADTFTPPTPAMAAPVPQKFSVLKATSEFVKGAVYDPIRSIFTLSGAATMAAGFGLVKLTKGFALIPLLAMGALVGGYQTLKGLLGGMMNAAAGNTQQAYDSFRGMGNGITNAALSMIGAKTALTSPKGVTLTQADGLSVADDIQSAQGLWEGMVTTGKHLFSALMGESKVKINGKPTGMSIWDAAKEGAHENLVRLKFWGEDNVPSFHNNRVKTLTQAVDDAPGNAALKEKLDWATQEQKAFVDAQTRMAEAKAFLADDGKLATDLQNATEELPKAKAELALKLKQAEAEFESPADVLNSKFESHQAYLETLKKHAPESGDFPQMQEGQKALNQLFEEVSRQNVEIHQLSPEMQTAFAENKLTNIEADSLMKTYTEASNQENFNPETFTSALSDSQKSGLEALQSNKVQFEALKASAEQDASFWSWLDSPNLQGDVALSSMTTSPRKDKAQPVNLAQPAANAPVMNTAANA